jgi:hypothetical protein
MTPQEFSQKIKSKYPSYEGVDDIELTKKIIQKYPEYKNQVNFDTSISGIDTTTEQDAGNGILQTAGDVTKGVGKSALSTLYGIGKIGRGIQKTIAKGAEKVGLGRAFPLGEGSIFDENTESGQKVEKFLEPKSGAEEAGKIVGDVLQYVIPASKVAKATSGASLISRMIAEGGVAGGIAAAQSGEIGKEARDVAIISSIIPGAGAALRTGKTVVGGILGKEGAGRIIDSLIKPLKKDLAYGKNPGKAVADEGITANTLDELETKISGRLNEKLGELQTKLAQSDAKITLDNVFKPFDDALETAAKQNNEALITRLQQTKKALEENLILQTDDAGNYVIQTSGKRNLADMTPEELTQFKRDIGEITAYTGNPTDDKLVNSTLQKIYSDVKVKIEDAVPEAKELNTRIADLISAKTATKYRADIAERQNLIGISEKALGAGGFIASIATGNPVPAILSLGAIGVERALGTPRAKTEIAKWLAGASNEQKKELFNKAPWFKGIIQDVIFNVSNEE